LTDRYKPTEHYKLSAITKYCKANKSKTKCRQLLNTFYITALKISFAKCNSSWHLTASIFNRLSQQYRSKMNSGF